MGPLTPVSHEQYLPASDPGGEQTDVVFPVPWVILIPDCFLTSSILLYVATLFC